MAEEPIVSLQDGKLRGKIGTDWQGGKYYSFQGIPYGKPPLGELRFKAPVAAEPWTEIRDATKEGHECYSRHMIFQQIVGSEDCLYLNVYTPELRKPNSTLKPVMVWIHGGGFTSGSGNAELYGPEFLLTEDIILVTINYRLGLLGFACFEDPSLGIPGNAGLKDQVLALKWVQKNIEQFCGDPKNVTVFGESAGGASVHYLMLSPMAKGLFHRAIAQSGAAISCWAQGQKTAPIVAKALKLNTADEKEIHKILKELPVEKVFEIQDKIPDPFIANEVRPLGPVVEKSSDEPAFLTEEPIDLITSGRFNKVPLLTGYTSREGMLSEIVTKARYGEVKLITDFERAVPHMLQLPNGSEMSKTVAQKIKKFYYGDAEPHMENIDIYYLLQTDNFFFRALHTSVKHQCVNSSFPIYIYRLSLDTTLNMYKKFANIRNPGACHADDLGYLFKNIMTPDVHPGSIEHNSIRRFTKLWANFARKGDPNPEKDDELINIAWKPAEKGKLNYLDIGDNLTVGVNPEAGRMQFWDEIYGISPTASKL